MSFREELLRMALSYRLTARIRILIKGLARSKSKPVDFARAKYLIITTFVGQKRT
jgi:hypothetical protein